MFKNLEMIIFDFIAYMQTNVNKIANHLLVVAAFFLSIGADVPHDVFQILLMLFIFFKSDKLRSLKLAISNPVVMSFLLYVVMAYLWVLFSDDMAFSYSKAKDLKFFLFSILIFVFIEYKYINRIITAFLLGVFISELFSYALSFRIIDGPFMFSYELASIHNPSPFQHHIHYGFILAIASVLLLELIYRSTNIKEKLIAIFFFSMISVNLVMNVSRTGYILYMIGVFIFVVLHYKNNLLKITLVFASSMIVAFLLAYNLSSMFHKRVDLTVSSVKKIVYEDNYSSSIGKRFIQYTKAIESWKERPITAHGTGMHLLVVGEERGADLTQRKEKFRYSTLDSQYFDLLVQFGVVGLLVFFNIFYQIARYKQPDKYLKELQYIFVVLYLLYSLQTGSMRTGMVPYLLFFLMTLTLVDKKNEVSLSKVSTKEFFLYVLTGSVLFIIAPYVM